MIWFIVKRLSILFPILFGISILTFLLIRLAPGDPAEAYLRLSHIPPTDQAIQEMNVKLGLDKPLFVQYVEWLGKVARLDFGISYVTKQPVWDELMLYFPPTFQLTITAIILTVCISVPIGIFSALYKDGMFDHLSRILSFVGASMPTFWLGFLLIYLFSIKLDLLPVVGRGTLANLVLPSLTLAFAYISTYTRLLRTSMLENLHQPFVFYARVRGLQERVVIGRHVLKMALLPVVTAFGMTIGNMLTGAFIVENVFAWPGLGRFFVSALSHRDYPVVQSCILLMGVIFVVCNLLVDIAYALLDPRIRWKGER
jgi:nickel transport system permease protein